MISFKDSLALATVLLCSLVAVSCSKPSKAEQVRKAFHAYMDAWEKGDVGSVWGLMSPRLKHGNDNSIEKFERFTKQQGFAPSRYEIGQVIVANKTAQVKTTILFSDSHGHKIGEEREECQFILNGNQWYFDDCKPSSTDKSS